MNSLKIETKTCTRCGGTGKHSFCTAHRDVCFKCSGSGVVYTKRGALAKAFLEASCSKPAAELLVGDTLKYDGGWYVITAVTGLRLSGNYSNALGERVPHFTFGVDAESAKRGLLGANFQPNELVRIKQTDEVKAEKVKAALAYQDSLTQLGKVKRKLSTVSN